MQQGYLMAILFATLIIPIRNARNPKFAQSAKRTAIQMIIFAVLWGLGCVYIYPLIPHEATR